MGRSCLDGYLTPECAKCPDWKNTPTECGCGIRAPIMECPHFAKMYTEEESYIESYALKLPSAIYTNTTGGETLLMEACSNSCYSKGYYPTGNFPQEELTTKIRKIKFVTAPFHVDGKTFATTRSLFKYLLSSGRYFKYPF